MAPLAQERRADINQTSDRESIGMVKPGGFLSFARVAFGGRSISCEICVLAQTERGGDLFLKIALAARHRERPLEKRRAVAQLTGLVSGDSALDNRFGQSFRITARSVETFR